MNALDLIREFEGYRDTPYWDVNAYRTGYGSDTVTLADGRVIPVSQGMKITRDDAERDLARRVNSEFGPAAVKAVGPEAWQIMTNPQRSVITSLAYNYGRVPENVAQAVRYGDMAAAEAEIRRLSSHNGGVNAKRRNREADIFAGKSGPSEDTTPVAYAYANGKMTPEDEALYEKGVSEGLFPKVDRASPADIYRQTAMRGHKTTPHAQAVSPLTALARNATLPWRSA